MGTEFFDENINKNIFNLITRNNATDVFMKYANWNIRIAKTNVFDEFSAIVKI